MSFSVTHYSTHLEHDVSSISTNESQAEDAIVYLSRSASWTSAEVDDRDIDSNEMAMTILNGLLGQYDNIIKDINMLSRESASFTLEDVKSRLLQGEQRRHLKGSGEKTETAFLSSNGYAAGVHPNASTANSGGIRKSTAGTSKRH